MIATERKMSVWRMETSDDPLKLTIFVCVSVWAAMKMWSGYWGGITISGYSFTSYDLNAYVLLTTFNKTDKKALRFVRFISAHLPSDMARKFNVVGRFSGILEL